MARILIADDDAATRDLLRRALEVDGHAVKAAADGAEALEMFRAGLEIDLLITDVQMPGIDGIGLATEAAALRPGLRLLMMSGYPDQLARAAALPVARVLMLSKPFTLEKARAEVRAALG